MIFGWPESDAEAEPNRVRKLKARIKILEAEVSGLKAAMGKPIYVKEER